MVPCLSRTPPPPPPSTIRKAGSAPGTGHLSGSLGDRNTYTIFYCNLYIVTVDVLYIYCYIFVNSSALQRKGCQIIPEIIQSESSI